MLYTVALVIQTAFTPDPEFLPAIQRELDAIYAASSVHFTLHLDSPYLALGPANAVLYVNLHGACRPSLVHVHGSLAFTESQDGVIAPLIDVDCPKLSTFVGGHDVPRALARVLAHEVFHFLVQDRNHSHAGVFRSSLTHLELTSDAFALLPEDLARLQLRLSY